MSDHGNLIRYPLPLDDGSFGYVYLPRHFTEADARRFSQMVTSLVMEPVSGTEATDG